ncbi:MAG: hypothetical protein SCH39_13630, partial [Methanosarcinales archaeon]|nr:hypothetical protein [Methanosarcinales archaeon]
NVCIFGLTGIPVLPPPNYVVQFNSWIINVEEQIDDFTLQDVDNEVHPNPMFGHEAQVYKRGDFRIIDPSSNLPIGNNFPIYFEFTTGTFIAVPPAGKPIGDREGYDIKPEIPFSETSSEYGKVLEK